MTINKKGIALLITVGFIALIMAVVLGTLTLLQEDGAQTQKIRGLAQTQRVIANIDGVLDELTREIKKPSDLELFLASVPPTIPSDDGRFILDIAITSLHDRINLNSIVIDSNNSYDNGQIGEKYRSFLTAMLEEHEVRNPDFMIALLLDTLDSDDAESTAMGERKLYMPTFSDGGIDTMAILGQLVDYYALEQKDERIYDVPWEKYFYFGPHEPTLLDCNTFESFDLTNHDDKSIARFINMESNVFFEPPYENNCSEKSEGNISETINGYNIGLFSSSVPHYYLQVNIAYELAGQKGAFSALYDLKTKRLRNIVID
ncbi:MAG: hypothetical protein KU37_04055 [Sulfuricurvum sp. PC08-66]|nr:MAG: hypothetical protein KU37_04055 [Sulfuricurvum sp. PC08-66]